MLEIVDIKTEYFKRRHEALFRWEPELESLQLKSVINPIPDDRFNTLFEKDGKLIID